MDENLDLNQPDSAAAHPTFTANQGTSSTTLTNEMVLDAVSNACDFFGIPEVPVVNAEGTCVWPNDSSTYDDDVFGFNREQLMDLGISGEDSLTLIYTHECAHRTLQSTYNDPWEEELACDFFAGVHAGMKGMNLDNFEASLGQTAGSESHPSGALRAEFIKYGKQIAEEMQERNVKVTYEGCIARFNQHFADKGGLIAEYHKPFDNDTTLADANTTHTDGEAKGFVNDKAWNEKQAQINYEKASWHENEASKAADRGDHAAVNDHLRSAQSYHSTGKDYADAASKSTK